MFQHDYFRSLEHHLAPNYLSERLNSNTWKGIVVAAIDFWLPLYIVGVQLELFLRVFIMATSSISWDIRILWSIHLWHPEKKPLTGATWSVWGTADNIEKGSWLGLIVSLRAVHNLDDPWGAEPTSGDLLGCAKPSKSLIIAWWSWGLFINWLFHTM